MSLNHIIALFDLSKGTLYYKKQGYPKNRNTKKVRQPKQVQVIEKICNERATYGIPRVKAISLRDYTQSLSYYMVWQIMKEKGLLIKKTVKNKSRREHTGEIMVSYALGQ